MMNKNESKRKLDTESVELIGKLYHDHRIVLLGYIKHSLRNPNHMLAEDILHETFYEAIRKQGDLVAHPNKVGWLMQVAKNKIRSYYKRASSHDIGFEECENELVRLEEQFGIQELTLLLDSVFDEHERRLFEMYFIEGYSAREIAKAEETTEGNFKVRMCRLRKKLLDKIGVISIALLFICLQWGGCGLL